MVKEIILFDIDYTLLNTSISKKNFRVRISELLNIPLKDFLVVEKNYVKKEKGFTGFKPEEYIDYISKNFNANSSDISKTFFDERNFVNTPYPEVPDLLESLFGKFNLGVFSEGFEDFQLSKLHKSNLLEYFDRDLVFIFRRKLTKEALDLIPKGCFIVDDNLPVVCGLVEANQFKPLWLNRKTKEKHERCKTIFDLKNLENVLENYSTK